jgi:hypothetical protein
MTLPKWLRWPTRLTPALFNPNITVTQFKSDPARVSALADALKNPVIAHAWSAVMSLAPPFRAYDNPNSALFDMGVVRGMRTAHEAFQFLATPEDAKATEPLESDWGVEIPAETEA